MSLTQIMSGAGLAIFPIIGLLFFVVAFVGVLWRVLSRRERSTLDQAATLPLQDGDSALLKRTQQ